MAFYFALMNVSNKKERRRSSSRPSHLSLPTSFYDTSPSFPSAPSNSFESLCGSSSQGEGTPNSIVPSSTASFPPPVRTSKKVRFKPQTPTPSSPFSSSPTTTRNYFLGSRRVSRLSQHLMPSEFLPLHQEKIDDHFSIDSYHLSYHQERHQEESIEVQVQNEYNTRIEIMESRRRIEGISIQDRDYRSTVEWKKNQSKEQNQEREEWREERVKVNWIRKITGLNMMSEIHFINPSFVCLDSERDWFASMNRQCTVY